MFPAKGIIATGSDADLIIWNPKVENIISTKTHYQNCDLNIYEGITTKGEPKYVVIAGNIVLDKGKLLNDNQKGTLLKTNPI